MARPTKHPGGDKFFNFKAPIELLKWLDEAKWSTRASKSDLAIRALELYLALRAPAERPAGYELSSEVEELVAGLQTNATPEAPDTDS